MGKQINNQRYIYRIQASLIKRNKGKVTFNEKDIKKNIKQRYIVGIGESTGLYLGRLYKNKYVELYGEKMLYGSEEHINKLKQDLKNIKNKEITDEYLEKDKLKDIKNKNNEILKASLQDVFCNVDFSNVGDKEWDKYSTEGFYINNNKYSLLLGTPGGIKKSIVLFVRDDIRDKLFENLHCGAKFGEKSILPSKIMAYLALTFSASTKVTNTNRILVVKDVEKVLKDQQVINICFDENREMKVTPMVKDIVLNTNDGCGLISPELSKVWSTDLRLFSINKYGKETGYISSGYCVRSAFVKGMLVNFDFKKYYKEELGLTEVKDVWGNIHNIDDIDIILNESMLKLNKPFYSSIEDYNNNREKYHYGFSVTKYIPQFEDEERTMNYQYLQCLNLGDEDIYELIKSDSDEIKEVYNGNGDKAILFGKGMNLNKNNVWIRNNDDFDDDNYIRALMINRDVIKDTYISEKLKRMLEKRIKQLKIGKIKVKGNYQISTGEPILQLRSMANDTYPENNIEVKGLLDSYEFYMEYWREKGVKQVGMFRSPMSCKENTRKVNISYNEEAVKWYSGIKNMIIFNGCDTAMMAYNGQDHDGDMNFTTSDERILKGIVNLPPIDCDGENGIKILNPTLEDYRKAMHDAFGNAVGGVTNFGSGCYDLKSLFEEGSKEYREIERRIQCIQFLQQSCIDSAKLGKAPEPIPSYWNGFFSDRFKLEKEEYIDENGEIKYKDVEDETVSYLKSLVVNKKPYYFRYIYDYVNKEYSKYEKERDIICIRKGWGKFKDLEKNENRTEEQENFYKIQKHKSPLTEYNGIVNKIARKVEDLFEEDFDKSIIKLKDKNFDSSIYLTGEYSKLNISSKEDKTIRKKIKCIYDEYKEYVANKDGIDDKESYNDYKAKYNLIKDEVKQLHVNENAMLDIMIDMSYNQTTITRAFVWNTMGDVLIENMLTKNNNKIVFPIKDQNGEIKYNGETFKNIEVVINKED